MTTHRSEKDSMGAIEVPADKLWGAQTQRSLEHFRISTEKMPGELIYALALTKRAAAKVNQDLGLLTAEKAGAIVAAADEVLAGWVLGGTWMVCTVLIMDSMARWRGAPAALARQ